MSENILRYRVLIVEDDSVSRELMEDMLARSEDVVFESDFCGSLKEALEIMARDVYDAVLLDLNLPDSQGMQTVKEIVRAHENIPVVVTTGGYGENQGIMAISEGAADYLVKGDFDRRTLIKSIQYAIERKKADIKLMTTQKMLARSEKMAALGRLISEISHEINNPLFIISGNAEISLMTGNADEETEKTMRMILDECGKAKKIIQRVLRFAKSGRGEVRIVNLCDCVENMVCMVENHFKTKRIKIERKYKTPAPHVNIDLNQLQEVVMNLLNNAKDAMPSGGHIEVCVLSQEDKAVLKISDTGSGISEEIRDRICDPFFTTKEQGVGLGLSICFGILKAHGGDLDFCNIEGKGAAFVVALPLVKER